jgi:hypothetical protein
MAVCFSGCIKKDPESNIAQVLLVPLSPDAPAIDFSIKNTLFATTVNYSTTAGTIRYTLPYYTIEPTAATKVAYNFTGRTDAVASLSKDMGDGQVFSTFLIDSFKRAKAVIVNDDLDEPTAGKVKLRFFHFSPNAPAVDVVVQGTNTKIFSNRSFNDQFTNNSLESFIEVDPGNYVFLFNLASNGATAYTTTSQTLLPDRIYTLAARGFVGGAGAQGLGAWLYPNKP